MIKYLTSSFKNTSVGTGLALESFFKPTIESLDVTGRTIRYDLNSFDSHYYNITTIIRNVLNSIDVKIKTQIKLKYIIARVVEEIEALDTLYKDTSCNLVFYHRPLKLNTKSIYNLLRKKELYDLYEKVVSLLDMSFSGLSNIPNKSLITTDWLLHLTECPKDIQLFESHIGNMKNSKLFHTKFNKMKNYNLSIIPITIRMIFLFGDSQIRGENINLRKRVLGGLKDTIYKTDINIYETLYKDLELNKVYKNLPSRF